MTTEKDKQTLLVNADLLTDGPFEFPFETHFSLLPLIRKLEERATDATPTGLHFKNLLEILRKEPALCNPVLTSDVIQRNLPLIELALTAIFPPLHQHKNLEAVNIPLHSTSIWANEAYKSIFGNEFILTKTSGLTQNLVMIKRTRFALMEILRRCYNLVPDFDPDLIIPVISDDGKLTRYYKATINTEFVDIDVRGTLPPLSAQQFDALIKDEQSLSAWLAILKPEHFAFRGFGCLTFTEVTNQEVLSALKYDLLQKDALLSDTGSANIEARLKSFFQLPNLQFGLAAFNPENATLSRFGKQVWRSLLPARSLEYSCATFHGCMYEKMTIESRPVVVPDLLEMETRTEIEEILLQRGLRSVMIAPLRYDDEIIGVIELASSTPGDFTALSQPRLHELIPLFSIALKRCLDELANQIQAIIKLNCSSLHPSVEWKFEEEALKILEQRKDGPWELPNIHFKDVYPLFGAADIRGSSTERSKAIQQDLLKQLQLFKALLDLSIRRKYVPIVDGLLFEVQEQIDRLSDGIQSGDENAVMQFLQQKVDPSLNMLAERGLLDREEIEAYRAQIDPQHGIIYERRRDFEVSVAAINQSIATLLDEEEIGAQRIFPHYFEKYKTDGVEYNMYLGRELNKINAFDPVYLKNLRLWQLMVTCKIQALADREFHKLPLPFQITQLVLVHSAPLTIVFRTDDKKFDVDGAYNIRYEIIKKRIDKALVKNTTERLTQPGKLAIIYVHEAEAEEYKGYLRFLQSRGFFQSDVEQLELQDLAGASGLKALRVSFRTS